MDALIASLFSFPTAIFSVALGVAFLYWLLVILGACDIDLLHIGDHDAGSDHDAGTGHNAHAILEFLRIGQVPVTIIATTFVVFAWIVSLAATTFVRPHVPGWSWWLFGLIALAAALVVGFLATGLVTAPLARIFSIKGVFVADDLVGKMVEVTSTTVDARFGTARYDRASGEEVIMQVVSDPQHQLKRGEQAVVMDYDKATGVYRIAPLPHTRPGFLAETGPADPPAETQPAPPSRNAQ